MEKMMCRFSITAPKFRQSKMLSIINNEYILKIMQMDLRQDIQENKHRKNSFALLVREERLSNSLTAYIHPRVQIKSFYYRSREK